MNDPSNCDRIRLILGGGHYLDQDLPTPEIMEAMKRVMRLVEAKKLPQSKSDIRAVTLIRDWMEKQHQKHGGVKYRNEGDRN
jgi:hypothetical protein